MLRSLEIAATLLLFGAQVIAEFERGSLDAQRQAETETETETFHT
ncbi:hypothetical protein [Cupriavidus basilensis]|uniref:Uncharacterized protein n=1 Tax=Cupriavidus basilensis TaxID=68895 RepID=A0A0C4YKX1_9BURK|nr:hypothetical protein RR42_s1602 [Cupriavidus basilensis]